MTEAHKQRCQDHMHCVVSRRTPLPLKSRDEISLRGVGCDAPGISEALTQNYTKASDELGLNHA